MADSGVGADVLARVVGQAAEAVMVTRADGTIVYVNDAFERLTGYSLADCAGQTPRILKSGRQDAAHYERYWAAILAGETWRGTMVNRRKDGSLYTEEQTVRAVLDERGQVAYLVSIGLDVSERERTLDELRLLESLTRSITMAEGTAEAFEMVLRQVCDLARWSCGEVWTPARDGATLVCGEVWYAREPGLEAFRVVSESTTFVRGSGLCGRVWASGAPEWQPDVSALSPDGFARVAAAQETRIRAGFAVPIVSDGEVLAVLAFFVREPREEDPQLVRVVSAVAAQLGDLVRGKQMEQERAGLAAIVEASVEAIAAIGLDGEILSWNAGAEQLYGYTAEEAIGRSAAILAATSWQDEGRVLWRRALAGERASAETVAIVKSGAQVPVSLSVFPITDAEGRVVRAATIVRNISERKRSEAALRLRTEQLAAVTGAQEMGLAGRFDLAFDRLLRACVAFTASECGCLGLLQADGVMVVRAHEGPPLVGRGADGGSGGLDPDDVMDWKVEGSLFGEAMRSAVPVIMNSLAAGAARGFPAGHGPVTSFMGMPIFVGQEVAGIIALANSPDGYSEPDVQSVSALAQASAVLVDSERRKEREAALEAQLVQSQKMEATGRLAGGIAHDFNNILTVILGNATWLAHELPAGSEEQEDAEEIEKSALRAADLTRRLLAFSRQQVMQLRPVDLGAVVAGAEHMLRQVTGEEIAVAFEIDPGGGTVQADPGQVEQALLNLVINARDAIRGRGHITISVGTADLAATEPRTADEPPTGEYVRLAVTDNGSGMDEETRLRIFEPFFTTKPVGQGTGLGLPMVYGIVRQSGGYIRVESEPGAGSTFSLYFPRHVPGAGDDSERQRPPAAASPADGGGETILLVDDDPGVRTVTARILERAGYTVIVAANGADALVRLAEAQGPVGLVLTDVMMPLLGGPELAERLSVIAPRTRVLFMSGYAEPEVLAALQERAGSFIPKPIDPGVLLRAVRECLDEVASEG